ncbi:hypothetical protein T440DRAFT_466679 [Plenodomus tracheiphilus IPT5]|uniref:DUF7165 domain-containing protein n=1 Tax=Plenodomus tracheiphilus IPT5 TaxID=1408161 RepID=A0A6A7BB16_9PLEO|nr:hypothetical protein T440DRAFT_466679 [Plenodomus tracheiphilus IPT5]
MLGRASSTHREAPTTSAYTDIRGKGVAFASNEGGAARRARDEGARSASMSSQSQDSGRNNTASSSGISGHSTAMTSATTYDDRPSAANPTTASTYAHPSLTLLELVSNTASSSALPDNFDVNVSRRGGFVAVYSSSNLWLIKTVGLPRLFARTLQVKRKPVAIDITEDGFLLAVLSRPSQVDLYEIHGEGDDQITKRRTISLVHEASSIVISPDARILITGNKYGIEVMAIGPDVPETARRTLSGPAGDALEFSDDGRTLLITGYARKSDGSALFVLPGLYDGPLTEEGEPIPQPPEAAWTGSVLFPESARIARQATLLPDADTGTFNELFAFNAEEDSWGIYDIACQRFTQRKMFLPDHQRWTRSEFVDDAMPAVSPNADLAAVALRMRGTTNIWIYEVPGWDYKPSEKTLHEAPIQPCFCIPIPKDDAAALQEICVLRWVRLNAHVQRLVAVGNSSVLTNESDVPGAPLGSKGVLIVLDFDKRKPAGSPAPAPVKTEYDLDPLCPGELLPEGSISFDREVELVRTRTIAQRRAQDHSSALSRRSSRIGSTSVQRARTTAIRPPQRPRLPSDDSEELTPEEAQAMFEAPYDNQQPRSHTSLARAATVAAVSPANRRHLRALPLRPLEYRRADGHRELPHESDADNWVPPPPAYTATAAAAESVSLSHPDVPPVPQIPRGLSSEVSNIPPVPSLPGVTMAATVDPTQLSPSNAYPQASISSVHLSSSPFSQRDTERRPSLLHPSTYPSPQSYSSQQSSHSSSLSQRRRSSVATTTSPRLYPTNPSQMPSRRPTLAGRRAVETSIDIRPPFASPDVGRRGSAPTVPVQRRGIPTDGSVRVLTAAIPNVSGIMRMGANTPQSQILPGPPYSHPHPQQSRNQHQHALPPLQRIDNQVSQPQPRAGFPLSAPPRTQVYGYGHGHVQAGQGGTVHRASQSQPHLLLSTGRMSRMHGGEGRDGSDGKKEKKKKKVGCVVM